jgi:hypothetical protein
MVTVTGRGTGGAASVSGGDGRWPRMVLGFIVHGRTNGSSTREGMTPGWATWAEWSTGLASLLGWCGTMGMGGELHC